MIWAIVLAAGESKRMGRPKQLLPFGKQTIIENVVEQVTKSKVDNTLIVLGANREKIAEKVERFAAKQVYNPSFREGMLSSIQTGFAAVPEEARAVLIVLGDQPTVPMEVMDRIIDAYRESKKGIILPVFKNRRGHPILIDSKYRSEVKTLDPEIGLKALVRSHAADIEEVNVTTPDILTDIDNPAEYRRESKKAGFKE